MCCMRLKTRLKKLRKSARESDVPSNSVQRTVLEMSMVGSDWGRYVLAGVVAVAAVGCFLVLVFVDPPQAVRDTVLVGFTWIMAKFQTVIDYYFGSSESSKEKTKLLSAS